GVFSQTISAKEFAERRADEAASARAALRRMTQDLQNARATLSGPLGQPQAPAPGAAPTPRAGGPTKVLPGRALFLGRVRIDGGVPVDDVAFTTIVRRPTAATFAGADLGIVHYFVAPLSPQSTTLGLYRETIFSLSGEEFDPDKANPGSSVLILPGVSGLDYRFFDGTDWGEEWDSSDSRNFTAAPLAVEMALTVTNDAGESERYQTAVDLPMIRNIRNPQVAARPTPRR
ncbi:MAG TPA: type II secretion system protein GspJ, partial [Candidatus Binatia bacterium]|nr:type II secretion system protein GspJ [Candidatus Binatia bacterium]